jgi:hypothetical protein
MHSGRAVFSQIMDFAPWYPFDRCVGRYGGDRGVRSFSCRDQFLCMAFAQLAQPESLRDIVASVGPDPGLASAVGARREPYPKAASGGGGATLASLEAVKVAPVPACGSAGASFTAVYAVRSAPPVRWDEKGALYVAASGKADAPRR